MTRRDDWIRALVRDWRSAELSPADRALLTYVEKVTREPAQVTAEDVERLREAGFDDRAILDACQVASYFAYVNRMADGLGVELEPYWAEERFDPTR